jgi:hypothetical protein
LPLVKEAHEIRLLTLLPAPFSDPIFIVLHSTVLSSDPTISTPPFEALSYTWGSPDDLVKIAVRDTSSSEFGFLAVTQNLAEALPYLRHEKEPRILWIDAICINQQDLIERSWQVGQMSNIYSLAKLVVVWLGPEQDDSTLAFNSLASFGSKVVVHDWNPPKPEPLSEDDASLCDVNAPLPWTEEETTAVLSLFNRPWFERLWIRQEIQLATNAILVCGYSTIPWNLFRYAAICVISKPAPEGSGVRYRLLAEIIVYDSLNDYSLEFLISNMKDAKCADPKDRVFGALNLLSEKARKRLALTPDYNKTTSQVYGEAAFKYMSTSLRLDLLRACNLQQTERPSQMPTWVPSWEGVSATPPTLIEGTRADGLVSYQPRLLAGPNHLLVSGLLVDSVRSVTPIKLTANSMAGDCYREIQRLAALHLPTVEDSDRKSWEESLCDTLYVIVGTKGTRAAFSKILSTEYVGSSQILSNPDIGDYIGAFFTMCLNRCLCTTDSGNLCLGPEATQPGDTVSVLLGCQSPMMIRATDINANQYQVVGETFVKPITNGEALLGPMPEQYTFSVRLNENDGQPEDVVIDKTTSAVSTVDPRWKILLGYDYEQRFPRSKHDVQGDWYQLMISEVVKVRGLDLRELEFV